MTVGKDVSSVFTDVLKCITTPNLELKKLVYLYIMNYASSKADDAILAVNTFHQDCQDTNPLVRALAIRTLGCLRVKKMMEYLCEPLRQCLQDTDPYVAKTAAICVAKLYDINPDLVETQGFLTQLRELLACTNPSVVSNAVAALCEIDENSPQPVFTLNRQELGRLFNAFEDCTEWGQIYILNCLVKYNPKDDEEIQRIVDKVTPWLQHANCAVVLGVIRVLLKHLDRLDREKVKELTKKMRPPLITMLSKEAEIQYVALRNINLILQKRPNLMNEMKVFFCNYADPLYVKMEKLEIMIMLINEKNIESVLLELKEYCNRADVEFVRKSVRAIGRSAIKLDRSAEKCVQVLLELMKSTELRYVIQESVVVIKDILRRYGHQYDHIIPTLLEISLDRYDEPDARASVVWIIGEYAEMIPNAKDLLQPYLSNFKDEASQVQLQLLTSLVKLFLNNPENVQKLIQDIFHLAMNEIENPDIRDRAFIYWRLLTIQPGSAKSVVCSMKPLLSDDSEHLDTPVLNELITNISTLSSVYHKPPSTFVKTLKQRLGPKEESDDEKDDNLLAEPDLPVLFTPAPDAVRGIQVQGKFMAVDSLVLKLLFINQSNENVSGFQIRFKNNIYGIEPTTLSLPLEIAPHKTGSFTLPCIFSKSNVNQPTKSIAVALRTSFGDCFFSVDFNFSIILTDGRQDKQSWINSWRSIEKENYYDIINLTTSSLQDIQKRLEENSIAFVVQKSISNMDHLYMSAKTIDGTVFLVELSHFEPTTCKLCLKSLSENLLIPFAQYVQAVLSQKTREDTSPANEFKLFEI